MSIPTPDPGRQESIHFLTSRPTGRCAGLGLWIGRDIRVRRPRPHRAGGPLWPSGRARWPGSLGAGACHPRLHPDDKRRLAAILAADMVGYSRLRGRIFKASLKEPRDEPPAIFTADAPGRAAAQSPPDFSASRLPTPTRANRRVASSRVSRSQPVPFAYFAVSSARQQGYPGRCRSRDSTDADRLGEVSPAGPPDPDGSAGRCALPALLLQARGHGR